MLNQSYAHRSGLSRLIAKPEEGVFDGVVVVGSGVDVTGSDILS
jgi:hypothetical protein